MKYCWLIVMTIASGIIVLITVYSSVWLTSCWGFEVAVECVTLSQQEKPATVNAPIWLANWYKSGGYWHQPHTVDISSNLQLVSVHGYCGVRVYVCLCYGSLKIPVNLSWNSWDGYNIVNLRNVWLVQLLSEQQKLWISYRWTETNM